MRISITDRCNLRCRYCMPADGIEKVPMSKILTYEQILRICVAATELGISRFKVTGGEPLVRLGCASFCRELKGLSGVDQVTLTTNGQLLAENLPDLVEAGIDGINISLDSLREDRYQDITGGGDLGRTLQGLRASIDSGIRTKVNCLLQQGFNDDELPDFARLAFEEGIDVRFVEIMPIGYGRPETGLSNRNVLDRLREAYPDLTPDGSVHGNGPAVYYRRQTAAGSGRLADHQPRQEAGDGLTADHPLLQDACSGPAEEKNAAAPPGAIGLISAMHDRFCRSCNRIRLTSQGLIKPCLCFGDSIDLRPALAAGEAGLMAVEKGQTCRTAALAGGDAEQNERTAALAGGDTALKEALRKAILAKPAGHTFDQPDTATRQPMMTIGG